MMIAVLCQTTNNGKSLIHFVLYNQGLVLCTPGLRACGCRLRASGGRGWPETDWQVHRSLAIASVIERAFQEQSADLAVLGFQAA